MAEDLQRMIDSLARALERSVAIDDLDFRLIAFTSHGGTIDPIRQEAILERQGPPRATAWVRKLGVARATSPMRIPANDKLGMLARVCIPLRAHDQHLGYLWLVDPQQSLTEEQLALAGTVAQQCAQALQRDRMQDALSHARERELLRDLLSDDAQIREMAAVEAIADDVLDTGGSVTVLCVGIGERHSVEASTAGAAIAAALDQALRGMPRRMCMRLLRPSHAVVVASAAAQRLRPDLAELLAADGNSVPLAVGVGGAVTGLADLPVSHQQAQSALRLAQVLPMFRPVARWDEVGVYGLLIELGGERLRASAVHPAVTALVDQEPVLAETLERFLDRAGDTKAVADDLRLHRATVYYRLDRIRQLTGVDLTDGEQRLGLHLGLKIRRMVEP